MSHAKSAAQSEARAFRLSMVANLLMGAAGVVAAVLSNSQAILVDGLFSLVGFVAGYFALRIRKRVNAIPDRHRPWGYAADEAIFTTFRALSLLGVVIFAILGAATRIYAYLIGKPIPEVQMGPVIVYFLLISATCLALWAFHYMAWRKGGKVSGMLRIEASSAAFDGAVTMVAGIGLIGVYYLRDSVLAPITPIGDSLIVILLCGFAISTYWSSFTSGLAELAGATAPPSELIKARRALREVFADWPGKVVDLALSKLGRSYQVAIYLTPARALTGTEVDRLTHQATRALAPVLDRSDVFVIISDHGRHLPELDPPTPDRPG
ncbi:cation transporter [Ruegeria sp. 2205SS24-7]|uniref:cation transporter n=1 Tax=Ruegeria discodermiae TaxID=3064389 RepID=UPI0027413843|nr:cation transporter [Ruegeria sp. 2205SS24-7]MDP5218410.1 cation transporter [Ruegeria sp. 2205SS24-7]